MAPRIALAGWFGSDNLGDELILHALAKGVRARGATPFAVSIRPDHTRSHHGIDSVEHRSLAHHRSLTRELRTADAMVVAGGVIQAETSPWNLPFHASRLRAASAARCPVATVGMGVGRVPGRVGRSLVRRTLSPVDRLVVRDHDSADRLRRWGVINATVGADPVLSLSPDPVEPDDTVCVILRSRNRRSWRTAAAKSRSKPDPAELGSLALAIEAVATTTGLTPRLTAFHAGRDDRLQQAVADCLTIDASLRVPTLSTVLHEVGRSRLVITMRYHGAIAALLHERPAVLLDYSPKMAALATEGGGWAPTVDPGRLTAERLVTAVVGAFDASNRVAGALAALRARLAVNDAALDEMMAHSPEPA